MNGTKWYSHQRTKRYAAIIVATTIFAYLLSYTIPIEYAAQAKISDEYKTTDLLIGLNSVNVMLRDMNINAGNEGTDHIEIYAKYLESEDFIQQITNIHIPFYDQNYQQYLGKDNEEETKKYIRQHILYNISSKSQTINLQVTDRNAEVASFVLKQTLSILKKKIEQYRAQRAITFRENARKNCIIASKSYHDALKKYNDYSESHHSPKNDYVSTQLDLLRRESELRYQLYRKATEEFSRAHFLVKKENTSFIVVKLYNLSQQPVKPHRWAYAAFAFLTTLLICYFHARYAHLKKCDWSNFFHYGNWFSPWSISISVWVAILSFYYILDTQLYPITSQFFYCLAIWLPIFCVCSLLMYHLAPRHNSQVIQTNGISINKTLFNCFFALTLVITPLYVYHVLQVVMMFSTEDFMNNVRTLALYGEGQGLLNYSIVINQSLLIVAMWAHPKIPLWQVITLVIACLMNSLAIMEKESMFFVFISIVFVLFEKKVIRIRSILIFTSILIIVFYIFNLGRAEEGSEYQKEETLLDFFAMYVLSPPVAFCQLAQDLTPQFGANTFEKIYVFLERFGVSDIVVKAKLQEFVWVPIPTNVYTVFQPFFIDFGYQGIAFFSGLYGCLCGWLYSLYKKGNSIGCCLYTYIVFALVLQFYQENIFHSLVFLTQLVFFITLFTQQNIKFVFNKASL